MLDEELQDAMARMYFDIMGIPCWSAGPVKDAGRHVQVGHGQDVGPSAIGIHVEEHMQDLLELWRRRSIRRFYMAALAF